MAAATTGYSKLQVNLHWLVALLIIFQIIGHESMVAAFDGFLENQAVGTTDFWLAQAHIYGGLIIWLFAAWRLYLRLTRGVPAHPEGQPPALGILANVIHYVLYGALLLMPISGSLAWFLGNETFGDLHSNARFVLLPAVLLHIAGGLAQHFYFKSNVLRRMMKAA